jgi:hypothetical protein
MRLLVVNVNTTTSMTDQIAAQARSVAAPGTQIVGLTPSIGVGSGPLPGRGQGRPPLLPRRTGRLRPNNRTPTSRPGHRGLANPVILERVTNMAIGTGLDNITEFEELALPGRGRPHRHLPAGLSRSAQGVASQRGGMR